MKILLTSLLFVLCLPALAQTGTVRGTITDRNNAEPVVFATVSLLHNDSIVMRTSSDINGFYSIKPVAPGTYTLKVSSIDYTEVIIRNITVNRDVITFQDIKMQMNHIELEEIVCTCRGSVRIK
jgi:hypothetical protein